MKKLTCPICNCDLKDWGISMEAINHYKPDLNDDTFILQDVSNLPYQDSKVLCGKCNEEIEIDLLNIQFII